MSTTLTKTLLAALMLGSALSDLAAETSSTPPAGFFKLTAQGASDNLIALPLVRRGVWLGRVTAVGSHQLTLATANAVKTGATTPGVNSWYYAEFVTGALAGLCYPVSGNDGATFTLDTMGDDLTAHALGAVAVGSAGDLVRIRMGWSVASVFGDGTDLRLAASPAFTGEVYLAGDHLLIPNNTSQGTEKKPVDVLAHIEGQGWRRRGADDADAGGYALAPWTPVAVRRGQTASADVVLVGYAPTEPRVVRLPALAADEEMDFAVTWGAAESQPLGASGLAAVLNASPEALAVTDLVLDYASVRRGLARPPEHSFYLLNGHWFEADVNQDGVNLNPASGYLLRLRGERPVRY